MTKRIITCLISLMLSITSSVAIFANENVNELTIDESNGYTTKLCYDDDNAFSVNTYKDGELIFSSYAKSDGNIYMLIDGKEVLAVEISYEQQNILSLANYSIRRAPSTFILTNSGAVQNIKISGSVIEAGKAAIKSAIIGAMLGAWKGLKAAVYSGASSALESLVAYIYDNCTTYDTNNKLPQGKPQTSTGRLPAAIASGRGILIASLLTAYIFKYSCLYVSCVPCS